MPVLTDLPLFPLGLVLYPNERLPLHIFEPRYKEMIRYCLDEDAPFGIALFNDGKLADMGCTARIAEVVTRYEDGRLDIAVRGEVRFRVLQLAQERAYLTAVVETIEEPPEQPKKALKERAITQHMKLLELAGRTVRPSLYQDVQDLSFVLAQNAGLSPEQKQQVLEILTENDRIAYLVSHFEALIPRVEEMEDVRRRVQSNGHFKDFPPERSG
jgi:Lon protease-like protein